MTSINPIKPFFTLLPHGLQIQAWSVGDGCVWVLVVIYLSNGFIYQKFEMFPL